MMKLEKREITLNEADSIKDAFYVEKTLLMEYVHALATVQTKEERHELLRLMQEVQTDMLFLQSMLEE